PNRRRGTWCLERPVVFRECLHGTTEARDNRGAPLAVAVLPDPRVDRVLAANLADADASNRRFEMNRVHPGIERHDPYLVVGTNAHCFPPPLCSPHLCSFIVTRPTPH